MEANKMFRDKGSVHGIGKAANAGGVTVSGLEMAQNTIGYTWSKEELDTRLRGIMSSIHQQCLQYGKINSFVDYTAGANITGFVHVTDAMLGQGHV